MGIEGHNICTLFNIYISRVGCTHSFNLCYEISGLQMNQELEDLLKLIEEDEKAAERAIATERLNSVIILTLL